MDNQDQSGTFNVDPSGTTPTPPQNPDPLNTGNGSVQTQSSMPASVPTETQSVDTTPKPDVPTPIEIPGSQPAEQEPTATPQPTTTTESTTPPQSAETSQETANTSVFSAYKKYFIIGGILVILIILGISIYSFLKPSSPETSNTEVETNLNPNSISTPAEELISEDIEKLENIVDELEKSTTETETKPAETEPETLPIAPESDTVPLTPVPR